MQNLLVISLLFGFADIDTVQGFALEAVGLLNGNLGIIDPQQYQSMMNQKLNQPAIVKLYKPSPG